MYFLSESDQAQIDDKLQDLEFRQIYFELVQLQVIHFPNLLITCRPNYSPKDINDDKPIRILHYGDDAETVRANIFLAEVKKKAIHLATFFKTSQRWYWIFVFTLLAMNECASVKQRQNGGRRDELTEDEINERLEILADVEKTKKQRKITYDQACFRLSERYSQDLRWSTVKKWRKYKNRPSIAN